MPRLAVLAALLIAAPLLAPLAAPLARAEVAAIDDAGQRVALAQPARRIVALSPHAAELVFAAGAGRWLAGTVAGSDYPAAAKGVQRVGDVNAIDLERVVALAPDLVVTWPYTTAAQLDVLRRRGVAVFTADAKHIDGIAVDIERLGTLAGTPGEAAAAAARFRGELAAATSVATAGASPGAPAAGAPAPAQREVAPLRVFYEVWGDPIYTIGGTQLITEAIARCGGVNVFASSPVPAPMVDVEAVIAADPQVIIAGIEGGKAPPWLDAWKRWPRISAVSRGALRTVDADLLHRPGPRFARGVAALCIAIKG